MFCVFSEENGWPKPTLCSSVVAPAARWRHCKRSGAVSTPTRRTSGRSIRWCATGATQLEILERCWESFLRYFWVWKLYKVMIKEIWLGEFLWVPVWAQTRVDLASRPLTFFKHAKNIQKYTLLISFGYKFASSFEQVRIQRAVLPLPLPLGCHKAGLDHFQTGRTTSHALAKLQVTRQQQSAQRFSQMASYPSMNSGLSGQNTSKRSTVGRLMRTPWAHWERLLEKLAVITNVCLLLSMVFLILIPHILHAQGS